MEKRSFTATIENAGGGGAFVRIPFGVEQVYGSKRPKVNATIDGEPYRGTLVRMGGDYHILGVLKDIRAKIGKDVGDEVRVVLEPDIGPRVVDVPRELMQALRKDPAAKAAFDRLSYTRQREYAQSISEAKKPETRTRRIAQIIEALKKKD